VIVARSISPNLVVLRSLILFDLLAGVILAPFAIWAAARYQRYTVTGPFKPPAASEPSILSTAEITSIRFDKPNCTLHINEHQLLFTYASNQYYLCAALLGAPRKKWAIDELLEKLGEHDYHKSWRKVYDATAAINKKVAQIAGTKLIVTNNKTYQVNPELVKKIVK
jgi:DNA-binding response OmpR family regulator